MQISIVLQRHVYTYLIPSTENMAALLVVMVMRLSSSAHHRAALTGPETNRQQALLENDGQGEPTVHEHTGSLQSAHTRKHTHACMYTHTRTHTHTHTHTHTRTHARTHARTHKQQLSQHKTVRAGYESLSCKPVKRQFTTGVSSKTSPHFVISQ